MKKLTSILILFLTTYSFSQKNVKQINSSDLIQSGLELFEEEKFEEAILKFSDVSINDSNYSTAQYESALCYYNQENYKKSIEILEDLLGLNLLYKYNCDIYSLLGTSYQENNENSKAIEIYSEGIKKFPMYYKLLYNRAYTYEKMEKFNEAIADYQKAIFCKPGHQQSHYRLGMIAFNEGQYTKGTLCLLTALIAEPNSNVSQGIITTLENISNGEFELKEKGFTWNDEESFDQLDEFLKNKVALEKNYKVKQTIKCSYQKQINFILDNLKYDPNNKGFWNQTYLPFLVNMYQNGKIDDMTLYTLQSSSVDKIQSKIRSKSGKISKYLEYAKNVWFNSISNRKTTFEGEFQNIYCNYKNGNIQSFGKIENDNAVGKWYYYFPSGALELIGHFNNNGEREGTWEGYNQYNGKIKTNINTTKNNLNGEAKVYYISGELKERKTFKDGQLQDTFYIYFRSGDLSEKYGVKNGMKHGQITGYHENGNIAYTFFYKDGVADGPYKSYFGDGKLNKEFTLKNDKYEGLFQSYFPNGQLNLKCNYKEGNLDGLRESYYANGKMNDSYNYANGKQVGKFKEFYSNGNLSTDGELDENGKQNGSLTTYDVDGKKYYVKNYKKGDLIEVICYDKTGKEIYKSAKKGKKIEYKIYYPEGGIKIDGLYENNERAGKWKYYDEYSNLSAIENFENGQLVDTAFYYHRNGQLKTKETYKNGQLNGLYLSYNSFGNLITEGMFLDGEKDKDWYWYYDDGSIKEEAYFINGEKNGIQRAFSVNGKISTWEEFEFGRLVSHNYLDTNENIMESFNQFHGKVEFHDPLKNFIRFSANYKNGYNEGSATWYGPNKNIETTGQFINDLKVGTWKYYHDNGKIHKEIKYINDDIDGIVKTFDENGKLKNSIYYENGEKNGVEIDYNSEGTKINETSFMDDEKHGKSIYYDNHGLIYMIRNYKNGHFESYTYLNKDGKEHEPILIKNKENKIETYYQNGQKSCEHFRKNGWIEGHYLQYYSNGQLDSDEEYKNGTNHGKAIYFYENGKKQAEGFYQFGDLEGLYSEYYENGNLKMTYNYLKGSLHGESKEYSKEGKLLKIKYYYNGDLIKLEIPK